MPNVMTYEGLVRTFTPATLWPQTETWGQHDYTMEGAQRGASFNNIIANAFGQAKNAKQFAELAQWENYEGYRAMYESGSKDRMGLLIWMSHACWPSMTWMCYDYYFEPTAAFFGCKKACEPLHIQWNALTRDPEVVNLAAGKHEGLTATRQILNVKGEVIRDNRTTLSTADDTTTPLQALHVDDTYNLQGGKVFFVRLELKDAAGKLLSDNFYITSNDEGNLQELNTLPKLKADKLLLTVAGNGTTRTVTVENTASTPAILLRLNLKGADGEQILPVDYSDNYFHLMPGEKKTVTIAWKAEDARAQQPLVQLSGFNAEEQEK